MSHHDNTHADPKEVENAQSMWGGFTTLVKWTVIGIAILLILMDIFLVA
jgi:hypothetical protein